MTHESNPTATIIVECELPEPREKVWKALTVPELLAKWLMPNNIRPEVGSQFQLEPDSGFASDFEAAQGLGPGSAPHSGVGTIECEVLEVEPNRRLRLSWREVEEGDATAGANTVRSIVTFDLSETTSGGTYLRLVHEGFEVIATSAVAANVIPLRRATRRRAPWLRKRPVSAHRAAGAPRDSLRCAPVAMAIQLRRAA